MDKCSSEITNLHKIVTVPKKIRFTGGMKGILTVPLYHKKDTHRGCDKGFLAAGQAKEIFSIKPAEFDALPACGRKYYRLVHKQPLSGLVDTSSQIARVHRFGRYGRDGYSFPKHVRDCAAAVLQRLGTFDALVAQQERALSQEGDKLARLEKLLKELRDNLHESCTQRRSR